MMYVCRTMVFVCLFALAAAESFAQQLAISGTVDDGTGIVVGAVVKLKDPAGATTEIATNGLGQYRFDSLRAGEYEVTVTRDGYAPATRRVTLTTDPRTVDVTLQVGGFATSVEVVAGTVGTLTESLVAPTNAGSRLNLSSLDTPATVSTITRADIQLRGDPNVNAAVTRAVGITSTASVGAANTTVAARGFGDTSIAYLYDGVRNMADIGDVAWPYDPWTVERIEVLNGPASVLYGVGGIGGSINVVPRRPSRTAEHTARISGGTFRTYKAALDSTGPVSDRILYRVDFSRQAGEGFLHAGTSESTALTGAVTFLISDRLKATVLNDWAYIQPMDYNGLPMVNGVPERSLLKENYGSADMDVHFYENSTRFELEWTRSPTMTVRNIASLLYADRLWRMGPTGYAYQPATNDVLRSGFGIWAQDQVQFTNLFDVTSKRMLGGHNNTLVVGGSFDHFDYTRRVTLWPGMTDTVSLLPPPKQGYYPATGAVNSSAANNLVTRFSAFAEERYEVTQALSLVGGLRFDGQYFDRVDMLAGTHADRTDYPLNPRAGAVYTIGRNTNLYGQFSQATDAPDYLFCCGSASSVETLEPSTGRQVEGGVKQSRDRFEWTLAGYWIKKKNLLIYDQTSGTAERYIQAGAQSSRGVEATVMFDLGRGLRVGGNGTVLQPKFDELIEAVDGVAVSRNGNKPPNVPWQSANLLATWAFMPRWVAQGAFRYVGERYMDTANQLVLPGYRVVDTTVSWSASRRVTLNFRTSNLFDAFYPVTYTGDGRGGANWLAGSPRTFELELTAGF